MSPEKINDEGIFLEHPGDDLQEVMESVLDEYPWETFYFLNEGALRERIGLIRDHFLPDNPDSAVAYAIKANPRLRILKILSEEGLDYFDCASPNEIARVKSVDPNATALYNHPIKRACDIQGASERGVHYFTAQTKQGINRILDNVLSKDGLEIAVRLQTLNRKAEIDLSTKFGAPEEAVIAMLKFVKNLKGISTGIAMSQGSQNTDPHTFAKGIKKMGNIARHVGSVNSMNIGGGIPVNYHPEDNFNINSYLKVIREALWEERSGVFLENPTVIIELGRSIIAEAVDLVIPVLAVEERQGQKCAYINDGLFTSFSDHPIHEWEYHFRAIGKDLDEKELKGKSIPFTLFGRTCDSGDKIEKVLLPENLQEGDFLHVANAGAYMDCQASQFNGFEPPKYVSYNLTP